MCCCHAVNDPSTYSLIRDIIVSLAAIATALTAYIGLSTWKHQIKDKTYFELARQILKSAFDIESAFKYVRHGFMSSSERDTALNRHDYERLRAKDESEGIETDPFEQLQTKYAYNQRLKRLHEALTQFEAGIVEARILWGDDSMKYLDQFKELRRQLFVALTMYLDNAVYGDPEVAKENFAIIYGSTDGSGTDPFQDQYLEIISNLRKQLEPYLEIRKK